MDYTSPSVWQSHEWKWPLCAASSSGTFRLAPTTNTQSERAFTLPNTVLGASEMDTETERDSCTVNLDAILRAAQQDWEIEFGKEGEQEDWMKYQESIALQKQRVALLHERKNQKAAEWAHKLLRGTDGNLEEH